MPYLPKAEQNNIEVIKETYTNYFTAKTKLTYERYTFNKILQKKKENLDKLKGKRNNASLTNYMTVC